MNGDIGVAIAVFAAAMLGAVIGVSATNADWRQELIAAGVGQYCPDTGAFAVKGHCP